VDLQRFDAITRSIGSARSRRQALVMLAATMVAAPFAGGARLVAAEPKQSLCLAGGKPCKNGGQCCSRRCKKKRGKRNGRCVGLGPFAANCPQVDSCISGEADWFCQAGSGGGVCISGNAGQPFCVSRTACTVPPGDPICATDADCGPAHIFGPEFANKGKCLACDQPGCAGGVMCALYAGDAPRR
jgi:hypothetical protein